MNNNTELNNNVEPTVPVQPQVPIYNPEIKVETQVAPVETANSIPTTPVEINNQEPEKKNNTVLYIIIGLIIVAGIAVVVYFLFIKKDNSKDNNTPTNNNNQNNEVNEPIEETNLDNWIGVYTNGENTITIYSYDNDELSIDFETESGIHGFYVDEFTNNKIEYSDTSFGEEENVTIERSANSNGIIVTATSTDTESLLNSASGEYTKKEFNEYGWSGTYTYENTIIVLNEVDENRVICRITKGSYTSGEGMSISEFTFRDVGINTLKYEGFDGDIINVSKLDNGIKVDAASEEADDLFNEISGNYIKE